jgi:predicted P-loop ATPase/5S rRNA maturation endonuclease (ribonuclease M5)
MNIKVILSRFENVKRNGSGWSAKCPAHEDDNPSLSIGQGKNGRVVLNCHAGCQTSDILETVGLKMTDLFPDKVHTIPICYDYRDKDGRVMFQVVRGTGKVKFWQRHKCPTGKNGWTLGLGGNKAKCSCPRVQSVPYRLPELLRSNPDGIVFIPEGEKDTDNLRKIGATAITNPGGAKKWHKEYSQYLEGRKVIILPDNDEVGNEHALHVAYSLKDKAKSIKILKLPNLPKKGDVSDWIANGGIFAKLIELVNQTPEYDFSKKVDNDERPKDGTWRDELSCFWSKIENDWVPKKAERNILIILTKSDEWKKKLIYNEFTGRCIWTVPIGIIRGNLIDEHPVYVQDEIYRQFNWIFPRIIIEKALPAAAGKNTIHPVREYLDSLKWDGTFRLDQWLCTYLGAEDNLVNTRIGIMWMISAVARIFKPGCQADHTLILEGKQGVGKSTTPKILAGADWCLEGLSDLQKKDAVERLQGKWIIEIAELDAFKGRRATLVKEFLTTNKDTFRKSYGHFSKDWPRQCVFIGTTNEGVYLQDSTGGRRFWPVRITQVQFNALKDDRDQLWAEAVCRYRADEPWWPNVEDSQILNKIRRDRYAEDPWKQRIAECLENNPITKAQGKVTMKEILIGALEIEYGRQTSHDTMRVGRILKSLGWKKARLREKGTRNYCYVKDGTPCDDETEEAF